MRSSVAGALKGRRDGMLLELRLQILELIGLLLTVGKLNGDRMWRLVSLWYPEVVSDKEELQRCEEVNKQIAWCFGVAWRGSVDDESFIPFGIVLERIVDGELVCIVTKDSPVDFAVMIKVFLVDLADVVLLQDIVHFLFLVDREQLPVSVDAATACSQNHFTARMLLDKVRDVVDASFSDDPLAVCVSIM